MDFPIQGLATLKGQRCNGNATSVQKNTLSHWALETSFQTHFPTIKNPNYKLINLSDVIFPQSLCKYNLPSYTQQKLIFFSRHFLILLQELFSVLY